MEKKTGTTNFATEIVHKKSVSDLIEAIKSLELLLEFDFRDVITPLTLYYDVAKRIGLDPDVLFLKVSKEVGRKYRKCLVKYLGRSEHGKSLASALYRWKDEPENCYVEFPYGG